MSSDLNHRAVLFDLDGTLLDTLEDLCDATNTVLASSGYPEHPQQAFRQMVGRGLRMLVTMAVPEEHRDPETLNRTSELLGRYLLEHPVTKTRPYPGIPEMLTALQERAIPMAILTNKPDAVAREVVRMLLGDYRFVEIQGQREGVPRKPDPTAARTICERMGCSPERAAFVGDSDVDIETALAAGMTPVGVEWGFRGREELLGAGAKRILSSPRELLELF